MFTCAPALSSSIAEIAFAESVHTDRIIGGDRNYRNFGGSAAARLGQSQGKGQPYVLCKQPEATGVGHAHVRRRQP